MITNRFQIIILIAVCIYFFVLIHLLKKRTLNLKYTLLWIFFGMIMLLLAVFPNLLNWASTTVGVYEPTNALFAIVFFCMIMILVSLTAIVSKMKERIKRLTQTIALMEKRLNEQESPENN